MEFQHNGHEVLLQGIQPQIQPVSEVSVDQVRKMGVWQ